MEQIAITDFGVLTGFGNGMESLHGSILDGKTSIKPIDRYPVSNYITKNASLIKELDPTRNHSMFLQLFEHLNLKNKTLPAITSFILASSKFEIDILEKSICQKTMLREDFGITSSINSIKNLLHLKADGLSVSAACASSTMAVSVACNLLQKNYTDSILILAGDIISPFVFSGFSSLMALDPEIARPFDKNRKGLSLGEGAAYAVLMNKNKALKEKMDIFGLIHGWCNSCDANHATGPSRTGHGLKNAILNSIKCAQIKADDIKAVSAHGTGTLYNDSMELKAIKSLLSPVPVYSIKGAIGHTLGACGLIEILLAIALAKTTLIPKTVGLNEVAEDALGWVHNKEVKISNGMILSTNSGFGGINSSVIVSSYN